MRSFQGIGSLLRGLDEAVFPSSLYCICCGAMIDDSRSYSFCDDCIRKFHWITGSTCEACGKALPERTVGCGVSEVPADEPSGGDPPRETTSTADRSAEAGEGARPRLCYDCMQERPLFTKGFSCVTYGLHEREIMMDLKYAGRGYIARKCGDMMFDRIEGEITSGAFSPEHGQIDMIVPVPIGSDRGRERGYNQSAIMATQLAGRWREFARRWRETTGGSEGLRAPVLYEDLLYRSRRTRKLRSLSPAERALELEGAFGVRSRYLERIKTGFAADPPGTGARILLTDDIQTTGATANACTKALLDAGASEVYFFSWASGGNRRPAEVIEMNENHRKNYSLIRR